MKEVSNLGDIIKPKISFAKICLNLIMKKSELVIHFFWVCKIFNKKLF